MGPQGRCGFDGVIFVPLMKSCGIRLRVTGRLHSADEAGRICCSFLGGRPTMLAPIHSCQ